MEPLLGSFYSGPYSYNAKLFPLGFVSVDQYGQWLLAKGKSKRTKKSKKKIRKSKRNKRSKSK